MDRLTYFEDGKWVIKEENCTTWAREGEDLAQKGIDRLAAYEDTELSPEICQNYKLFEDEAISKGVTFNRIVELMNAEEQGRLIVLPCKVGDTVFVMITGNILPFDVISVTFCRNKPHFSAQHGIHLAWGFGEDDIGKTVFLTREEAERAWEKLT